MEHSSKEIADACPLCNPATFRAKKARGSAFAEHLWLKWDEIGEDGAFTIEERFSFFAVIRDFLKKEGFLDP